MAALARSPKGETVPAKDEVIITGPTNFRRDMHVGFNQSTGQFQGLPQEWKVMSASGISKSEIVSDHAAVLEVLQFASNLQKQQQQQSLERRHRPLPPPPSLPSATNDRAAPLQATPQHSQSLEDRPLPELPPISSDAPPRSPRGGQAQPPSRNALRLSGASRPTSTVTDGTSRYASSYSENVEESLDQSLYSRMIKVLGPTPQSDEPTTGMEWVCSNNINCNHV